jgi:type IV secretory pathway VirJ component
MKRVIFTAVFILISSVSLTSGGQNIQDQDIPVIITNPKNNIKTEPLAIIISGDGGWYKFEQNIADSLAVLGIPTIGLDTKKYFWNRRTPEETAADLSSVIKMHNKEWQRSKFIFVGYSLGAELVPFIVNKLPQELKTGVTFLALLSPTATTDFQVHLSDMIGAGNRHNTYKVVDEISKITSIPVLLIFGADEKTTVPAMLTGASVKVVTIPGDHHFNHDVDRIVRTMKEHNAF